MTVTLRQIKAMLLGGAASVTAARDELTDIDSRFGDADHGITMEKIMKVLQKAVEDSGENCSIRALMNSISIAVMIINGGSAVPLWTTLFDGLAEAAPDRADMSEDEFRVMFRCGYGTLFEISKAKKGDKTMMDALEPALSGFVGDGMLDIAVAVRCATHPASGASFGDLGDEDMEIGMGQHGEGGGRQPMKTARETIAIMANALVKDIPLRKGDRAFVMVNGSGSTTLMEQFILYKDCVRYLENLGIEVAANMVGEILTVQEQAGFQLNLARWNDEFLSLWNTPARTIAFSK